MTQQAITAQRGAAERQRAVSCYVALGDSFAATDARADTAGWADLVAASLRTKNPLLEYRNVATAGASSLAMAEEQLPQALLLEPDLVTVNCGADELLLSSSADIGSYAHHVSDVLRRLRRGLPRATVVTATYPDFVRLLGLPPSVGARVGCAMRQLNEATRSLARRHRLPCVDLALHRAITACSGPPSQVWREQNRLAARAVVDVISRQPRRAAAGRPRPATKQGVRKR